MQSILSTTQFIIDSTRRTDLIEAIGIHEAALAAIAVVRGMGFINMVIQSFLICKDVRTVLIGIALEPMHGLLVFEADTSSVYRPSLSAPAAFNLIHMEGGVVEMISYAVVIFEMTTTTRISHCESLKGRRNFLKTEEIELEVSK